MIPWPIAHRPLISPTRSFAVERSGDANHSCFRQSQELKVAKRRRSFVELLLCRCRSFRRSRRQQSARNSRVCRELANFDIANKAVLAPSRSR